MMGVGIGIEAQPIGGIAVGQVVLDLLLGPVGQQPAQRRLGRVDPALTSQRADHAGHQILGPVIEFGQQGRLPGVPAAGTDRADIGGGQDQQQPQTFRRLDQFDEVADGLVVFQVALEGGIRHVQVPAHQPDHRFRLFRRKAKARAQLLRHLGAQDAVVAAASLGDVVKHHRDIERPARHQLVDHLARQRQLVLQCARLDVVQDAEREQRVLVHREDMVHVVLHLGDDPAEIRHETAQHAGIVHPAQRHFRVLAGGQHLQEQPVGLRVRPAASGPTTPRARVSARSALGWMSSPWTCATWNRRMVSSGLSLNWRS